MVDQDPRSKKFYKIRIEGKLPVILVYPLFPPAGPILALNIVSLVITATGQGLMSDMSGRL